MIDTHAHIDVNAFDEDRDEMIQRAFAGGIEYIIVPGIEPKDYIRLFDLTAKYTNIYCGMGVHPHNANDASEEVFLTIRKNCENENVKAIGETGIDYFYDFAPKALQQNVFREHLKIAKETGLPAIVHNREADDDILKIIDEEQDGTLKGVLHCFSSPVEVLNKALELGFHISFTGNITFKKSNLDDVVSKVPLDKVMLETDSPFMTPVPFRGKRNEPANVKYIAEKIAQIKSISIDEVIKMTTRNAKKLFNLTALFILFFLSNSFSNAQSIKDDLKKSEKDEELEFIHPYPKFIGVGPVIGINTVVETYFLRPGERDETYDGLPAYGAAVAFGVMDNLILEMAYTYSKNKEIAKKNINIEPSVYQNLEITSHWIINPYSRINFFGTIGLTAFFNSHNNISEGVSTTIRNEQIGWNSGLGLYINFDTEFGLFDLVAEWRINFETKRTSKYNVFQFDTQYKDPRPNVDTKSFYSLPRITIMYFPQF